MAPSVDGLIHNANVENRPERTQSSTNPVTGGTFAGAKCPWVTRFVVGTGGRGRQGSASSKRSVSGPSS